MSRDVLSPPLQRMSHNRSYRVNLVHEDFAETKQYQQQCHTRGQQGNPQHQGYVETDLYNEDDDCDDENEGVLIEELPNGQFKLTKHVPSVFYGGIIGHKGSQKRRIETETHTEFDVPRPQASGRTMSEDIIIKGKTRQSVCSASRKIGLLVASLRKRTKITHFVGVALNFGEVRSNYAKLKADIQSAALPGIDESLFVYEENLHLTFAGCVLLDDIERAKAVQLLATCRDFLHDLQTPFPINVAGLEIMNDDPSSTGVLYGRAHAPQLQTFADRVAAHFQRAGLATDERANVKLHMTIMNNRYRKRDNPQAANSFDAREILKRYGNYDFGTVLCNAMHIHILGGKPRKEDSRDPYYKLSATLVFDTLA